MKWIIILMLVLGGCASNLQPETIIEVQENTDNTTTHQINSTSELQTSIKLGPITILGTDSID